MWNNKIIEQGGINLQNEMWDVRSEAQGGQKNKKKGKEEQRESDRSWERKDWGTEKLSCQVGSEGNKKMRWVYEMKKERLEEN